MSYTGVSQYALSGTDRSQYAMSGTDSYAACARGMRCPVLTERIQHLLYVVCDKRICAIFRDQAPYLAEYHPPTGLRVSYQISGTDKCNFAMLLGGSVLTKVVLLCDAVLNNAPTSWHTTGTLCAVRYCVMRPYRATSALCDLKY
eukprot:853508-Rhodomonas_salina.2